MKQLQEKNRLSNRPEFSGTVPIFGAMSRIPNFHLIVRNFLREPVTEIGPPKKVTECLQTLYQSVAIHLKYLLLVSTKVFSLMQNALTTPPKRSFT